MKFIKKPIMIEAFQWFSGESYGVEPLRRNPSYPGQRCSQCRSLLLNHGQIATSEGNHIVCPTDWIITGIKGEKYPCKPDIFEATYEKVED